MYLCHLYAHLCNARQLTQYAKNSPQYYSRFHDPSHDLTVTCQSTTFKRGSVSPSSAHSFRILAMKEQEQEHCISTIVLRVCKNKASMHKRDIYMLIYLCHLCAYAFMSLVCSSMQCLAIHTICKELSPQYYSRFHDPSHYK